MTIPDCEECYSENFVVSKHVHLCFYSVLFPGDCKVNQGHMNYINYACTINVNIAYLFIKVYWRYAQSYTDM